MPPPNDIIREIGYFTSKKDSIEVIKEVKEKARELARKLSWSDYTFTELFDGDLRLGDIPANGMKSARNAQEALDESLLSYDSPRAKYQVILRKIV